MAKGKPGADSTPKVTHTIEGRNIIDAAADQIEGARNEVVPSQQVTRSASSQPSESSTHISELGDVFTKPMASANC